MCLWISASLLAACSDETSTDGPSTDARADVGVQFQPADGAGVLPTPDVAADTPLAPDVPADATPTLDASADVPCMDCCEPGAVEPCYDGPEGTAGVGACAAGTRGPSPILIRALWTATVPRRDRPDRVLEDDADQTEGDPDAFVGASSRSAGVAHR